MSVLFVRDFVKPKSETKSYPISPLLQTSLFGRTRLRANARGDRGSTRLARTSVLLVRDFVKPKSETKSYPIPTPAA
ncbi:MAG: hypothetical protein J5765_02985, partial [Clostridia bacterium]|nr:hypothetical protein [Clostridia bacterium]